MTDPRVPSLHLGFAVDGFGQHPAARRVGQSGAGTDPRTYVAWAQTAEAGLFDFVILDDAFVVRSNATHLDLNESAPPQLDSLLTLARVAPLTSSIGLVASINTIHTEPFNIAKNIGTLDWVSGGRAGWQPTVTTEDAEYALFGRRERGTAALLQREAAEVIDVVSRLCDSWEDGAIIRDRATGRYLDRDQVHRVDFEGEFFRVRGPSITPRSPQGQPLVMLDAGPVASADHPAAADNAVRWADVIFVDAATPEILRERRSRLRDGVTASGRDPDQVFVMARIEVFLGQTAAAATTELAALDAVTPWPPTPSRPRFVGGAGDMAPKLVEWAQRSDVDGFVVTPARLPDDLDCFVEKVVPMLQQEGLFRTAYEGKQLRDHFGLSRPLNRYAPGDRRPEGASS